MELVQEKLSRAECQNADHEAYQKHTAAQHGKQLIEIRQERQQIEQELKIVKAQHDAAITKADKVCCCLR